MDKWDTARLEILSRHLLLFKSGDLESQLYSFCCLVLWTITQRCSFKMSVVLFCSSTISQGCSFKVFVA